MSDSDYTLIQAALELGGRVVDVWEECASGDRDGFPFRGGSRVPEASPLSTSHISPFLEYRAGASILKAHRGGEKEEQKGGGKRGGIAGFSDDSRRRLLRTIGGVRRDADLPLFVTLTYPEAFPDPKQSKRHLDIFFKRLKRAYSGHGSIWKLEPQQRGAPHYHILTWGVDLGDLMAFVPHAWYKIAGGGDGRHLDWHLGRFDNQHCVQQVRTWRGVWSYASKYLGKTFDVSGWGDKWTGRYWGVINRENVPFGELVQEEVSRKTAVDAIRYQRRFSGLRRNSKSLTIFCDADQWVRNLVGEEVISSC